MRSMWGGAEEEEEKMDRRGKATRRRARETKSSRDEELRRTYLRFLSTDCIIKLPALCGHHAVLSLQALELLVGVRRSLAQRLPLRLQHPNALLAAAQSSLGGLEAHRQL